MPTSQSMRKAIDILQDEDVVLRFTGPMAISATSLQVRFRLLSKSHSGPLSIVLRGHVLMAPHIDAACSAQANITLRLMPLGGSITYGVGSSHQNGYREYLRQILTARGYQVQMLGSRRAGSMYDNANEGWRGYRIDQIFDRARMSVPIRTPNLFTLNAGSNDCVQNHDILHAGERIHQLIEYLWGVSPHATVVLSTLVASACDETDRRTRSVNQQLVELVQRLQTAHKRIALADMQGSHGPERHELVDGTHPNDQGYQKMAHIWADAVEEAVAKGFLGNPTNKS